MLRTMKFAALIGCFSAVSVTAQAAAVANGTNLNGKDLNGTNLNGTNLNGKDLNGKDLNGTNLNGTASERVFFGADVTALIAPDGTLVTLD